MPIRTFSSPDATISVEVNKDVFNSMAIICRKSPNRETGGILVGKYLNVGKIAQILEALPPSIDSVGTRSTFNRGIHGLSNELTSRWAKTGSHYVGEWHYHPLGNGQPSDRDISQMINFAREESMQSPVPIMVIVFRSGSDQYELRTFLFTQDGRTLVLNDVKENAKEGQ
jgi:proteasome lid subunit RPN8/RPN11